MARPKGVCVDCWVRAEDSTLPPRETRSASSWRKAPHPGPRCVSDHRAIVKTRKAKAAQSRDARVYGLAPGGHAALVRIQGGVCPICLRANGKTKRLAVEHDHKRESEFRGGIRGAVCGPCNKDLLGHCRDSVEMLQRAIDYLLDPPANRLGDEWFIPKGDPR